MNTQSTTQPVNPKFCANLIRRMLARVAQGMTTQEDAEVLKGIADQLDPPRN